MDRKNKRPSARLASIAEIVANGEFCRRRIVGWIFEREERVVERWAITAHTNYHGIVVTSDGTPFMCGCGGSGYLCREHALGLLGIAPMPDPKWCEGGGINRLYQMEQDARRMNHENKRRSAQVSRGLPKGTDRTKPKSGHPR